MALAPNNKAWKAEYYTEDGYWYANFMLVDIEYDGFMVTMTSTGESDYELTIHTNGSKYIMLGASEMNSLHTLAKKTHLELRRLEEAWETQ